MQQNQAPSAYAAHLDILKPIPRQIVEEIEEPAARDMIEALQAENISLSGVGSIASTFVGPADKVNDAGDCARPFLHPTLCIVADLFSLIICQIPIPNLEAALILMIRNLV